MTTLSDSVGETIIVHSAIAISYLLFGLGLFTSLLTLAFITCLRSPQAAPIADQHLPNAAIILSVRGADPNLADCVRALLQQNYPQYKLQIVVDSQTDPAWTIIHQVIAEMLPTPQSTDQSPPDPAAIDLPHVRVSPLRSYYPTCSLKCSAILQAIAELEETDTVVAFVDADVIVHPDWLRALVQPLQQERIGMTTGIRWFMPTHPQWGSLVRYLWNITGFIVMYVLRIPWGGSMAIKRSLLDQGILAVWKQSLGDDTPLSQAVGRLGFQIKFVPTAVTLNRENCDFAACWRFVNRQLLVTRLYHWGWNAIFITAAALIIIPLLAIGMIFLTLSQGYSDLALGLSGNLLGFLALFIAWWLILEQIIRSLVQTQQQPISPFSAQTIAKILVLIPFTIGMHMVVIARVVGLRQIEWRGITYEIDDDNRIRLQAYRPYQGVESASSNASIL